MNELEEVREILGEVCDHLLINIDNGNYDNLPSVVNIARSRAILAGLLAKSKKEAKSSDHTTKSKTYETVVYDGQTKEWRILNLSTGTIYASRFPNRDEAEIAILQEKLKSALNPSPMNHSLAFVRIERVLELVSLGWGKDEQK